MESRTPAHQRSVIIANPIAGTVGLIATNLVKNYNNSQIGSAYADGETFINNFNHTWKDLIGALDTEISYSGTCECSEYQQGTQIGEPSYIPGEPGDCIFYAQNDGMGTGTECHPYYVGNEISKPSDGFILAESAMNAPGLNYDVQFMPGSNHIQMRNDPNTKTAMDEIFQNGIGKPFFITEPK